LKKVVFTGALLLFLCLSCHNRKINYIARVGNEYLTAEELLQKLPESSTMSPLSKNYVNSFVSAWVKKEVLFQQAKAMHFDRDPLIKARVEEYYRDLVIDAYVKYYFQTNITISEEEIRDYYLKNKNSFLRTREAVQITHVLVQDFNDAMAIKAALANHNKEQLDKYLSKYRFETKSVQRGESLSELDRTIFETPPRTILGPIATNYGYHIVEVLERYPLGSMKTLDEVRDEIYQILTQIKIREYYDQLITNQLKDADFEIKDDNLTNIMSKPK
jgi:hypothetical protein